ncbi:hypothetical protein [Paenibacillus xylanexedens]|uniref:hypothetical protein n=1 Tax=Paenibacillus xylanexedens TaxID=528191 RepID=UPI003F7AD106
MIYDDYSTKDDAATLDVLAKGVDQETAAKLVEAAHQAFPYSRATLGNLVVELNVL